MKPKCPKCGGSKLAIRAAYDRTVQTEVHCGTVDGFVVFKGCGWSKKISDPAIIRLAVGKPETCKWTARRSAFNPLTNYKTGCGGYAHGRMGNYCSGCGKPVRGGGQ